MDLADGEDAIATIHGKRDGAGFSKRCEIRDTLKNAITLEQQSAGGQMLQNQRAIGVEERAFLLQPFREGVHAPVGRIHR